MKKNREIIKFVDIPRQIIDTKNYDNLLHDKIIYKFEEEFADDLKYALELISKGGKNG